MKNIQKIADEIFKAPTTEELTSRIEFMTKSELLDFFEQKGIKEDDVRQHLVRDFPNGAYVMQEEETGYNVFKKFKDLIEDKLLRQWKFFRNTHDDLFRIKWYDGQLINNKYVYKLNARSFQADISIWSTFIFEELPCITSKNSLTKSSKRQLVTKCLKDGQKTKIL